MISAIVKSDYYLIRRVRKSILGAFLEISKSASHSTPHLHAYLNEVGSHKDVSIHKLSVNPHRTRSGDISDVNLEINNSIPDIDENAHNLITHVSVHSNDESSHISAHVIVYGNDVISHVNVNCKDLAPHVRKRSHD